MDLRTTTEAGNSAPQTNQPAALRRTLPNASSGASASADRPRGVRRLVRRMTAFALGLALPTYAFTRILSLDPVRTTLNRRLWCSDAERVKLEYFAGPLNSRTGYNVRLRCLSDDRTLRVIGGGRLDATCFGAAFLVSALMLLLAVVALRTFAASRRRRRQPSAGVG